MSTILAPEQTIEVYLVNPHGYFFAQDKSIAVDIEHFIRNGGSTFATKKEMYNFIVEEYKFFLEEIEGLEYILQSKDEVPLLIDDRNQKEIKGDITQFLLDYTA